MFTEAVFQNKTSIKPSSINSDFVSLFNKPGPYYSSYPILGEWKKSTDIYLYENALREFALEQPDRPTYLYLHIPYCAKLCYYCSCRIRISNNRTRINRFVKSLIQECNMLEQFFVKNKIKPNIKEIHLGGGTPSHLTVDELGGIVNSLRQFVDIDNLDEFSMEIDPRTVSSKDFDYYASFGVDRISFGVQDFDPTVQKNINRVQTFELIDSLMEENIRKQFKGVNFDLLYGLPGQTLRTFRETTRLTKLLSPERITLIRYSHIPKKRKHMKMIREDDLPDESVLPHMFVEATDSLINGGYSWVGIDHFAKKDDQLAIAKEKKEVYRNFGGETPGFTKDIICLGPTSTSSFGRYYFQATDDLQEYERQINNGIFPISKGYVLNEDDKIRRECNFELQCNQRLDTASISEKYNINFSSYFEKEIGELKNLEKNGLLYFSKDQIEVTTVGRYFVRHICQIFDTFIDNSSVYQVHGP
jgi:oxygen-independent coproporphyrinogen-3 oxidase